MNAVIFFLYIGASLAFFGFLIYFMALIIKALKIYIKNNENK